MRVVVVGAGIGGLAVAGALQRAGADVAVLERAPCPPTSGSGLSLFGNGITALDTLGVGDAVRTVSSSSAGRLQAGQRDPSGRWLSVLPPDAVRGLRVVHRADLFGALMSALDAKTVHFGTDVVAAKADGTVTSRSRVDGGATRSERADVVVGADGIRSAVRREWPVDPGIRYAGCSAWRAVTDEPVDLRDEAGETWGRGMRFGIAPLADRRVYWFAVASMPPRSTLDDEAGEVLRRFGDWHAPIPALIAATDPATVTRLDIEHLAGPLPSFVHGRLVLLGDAAHAMTPDLGQGANQALEDAATLALLLAPAAAHHPDATDVTARLARYDRLRRRRTQRIARQARAVGRVAQASHPIVVALRDLALRVVPAGALAGPVRAIQSWTPPQLDQAGGVDAEA